MKTLPFLIHALSPLHAGTGHAAEIIDLPIARMKATGIPFVPGSSIKGVLRDHLRTTTPDRVLAIFGPEKENAGDHAGAVVVGDARLLALPVRTFKGTFAWVTSPLLLTLARRDLGVDLKIPVLDGRCARTGQDSVCTHHERVYLEDLDLPVKADGQLKGWTDLLAKDVSPGDDIFSKRFVVVDDDTMSFLWETATQVDARVRLEEETRTVADRALWLEESLPPETLLIGLLGADCSRRPGVPLSPEAVLSATLPGETHLQLGGKATVGRGRCRVLPMSATREG